MAERTDSRINNLLSRAIDRVVQGRNLSEAEMMDIMEAITDGAASPAQIGALLVGLAMKGETVDEITGAARVLRARCLKVNLGPEISPAHRGHSPEPRPVVDTCGTGGGPATFNVSTAAAFVVAGAGLKVAKHGNRAVTSSCGSADVLEALGVNLDLSADQAGQCLSALGLSFLYAPTHHSSMRFASAPRRELGVRTLFNLLGPLTNPAGASVQLVGVFKPELTETLARSLDRLGCRAAKVVCGQGGFDEITVTGPTRVTSLTEGRLETTELKPEDLGLARAELEDIQGGDALQNAETLRAVLDGHPGPVRDMVLLNAAAAITAAGRAGDMAQGLDLAARSIDSGAARAKLNELITFSNRLGRASLWAAG